MERNQRNPLSLYACVSTFDLLLAGCLFLSCLIESISMKDRTGPIMVSAAKGVLGWKARRTASQDYRGGSQKSSWAIGLDDHSDFGSRFLSFPRDHCAYACWDIPCVICRLRCVYVGALPRDRSSGPRYPALWEHSTQPQSGRAATALEESAKCRWQTFAEVERRAFDPRAARLVASKFSRH